MRPQLVDFWRSDPLDGETDEALIEVFTLLRDADPDGSRLGRMMRNTLDQLYDGQRTGRYSWAQLHKTERTHFGTLFEINLRREFDDVIDEGQKLDYRIAGHDVDAKFSQKVFGWMIPPEAFSHLLVVGHVDDVAGEFALGVVRASEANRRLTGSNRDSKVQLNPEGRSAVRWIHRPGDLPPNVLLRCDDETLKAIFGLRSGQKRVNELFRRVQRERIGRNTVATVAQQDDFMKRVRENGGARSSLRPEGIVILGGDYSFHRRVAESLGLVVPESGEMVSVQLTRALESEPYSVAVDGGLWRAAHHPGEVSEPAPIVPHV